MASKRLPRLRGFFVSATRITKKPWLILPHATGKKRAFCATKLFSAVTKQEKIPCFEYIGEIIKYSLEGMRMAVIAVLNQKGGSGKTTIATHLARALQIGGYSVTLVDSDPQGSARDWAAANELQQVPVVGLDRPTLQRDIKALAPVDYVVIDGAPQISELAASAIKAADFVLIPVQPSPYDIWAAADLVDLVKQRIEVTDGRLKAAFVISRAIHNTKLGAEVAEALQGYGLPVLAARIYQRVSYPSTAASGRTVFDTEPSGDAAMDFAVLRDEILHLIK